MRRSYWTVILCGGVILTIAVGMRQGFGLFLKPITTDIAVSREVFSFAIALQNIVWGVATPFFGAWGDKAGTGRALAAGGISYTLGLLTISFATGPFELIAGNLLIGLGLGGAGFTVVIGAVARASPPEIRSSAIGYAAAAGSFGQFALVPITQSLITGLGWSMALVALSGIALLMIPASIGVAGQQADRRDQAAQSAGAALREAFGHSGFWLLVAGFFVCGFQLIFVSTHLPAFLADQAMPTWLAAWALAFVGLFNIVGSYAAGYFGGRYRKKYLLAGFYLARSVIFILFLIVPFSEVSVLLFGAAMGLLWLGTVPLTSGLVAQIFGPTYLSMLYGIVFMSHQLGSFFGAWLGGLAYDLLGSYDAMWWICAALGIAAALLHWPIRDRPLSRPVAAAVPA
jgi:predicted MFS family arabinose efflux permease